MSGAAAAAQGEVAVGVPPAAGLLRRAVPGEGPLAHAARRQVTRYRGRQGYRGVCMYNRGLPFLLYEM